MNSIARLTLVLVLTCPSAALAADSAAKWVPVPIAAADAPGPAFFSESSSSTPARALSGPRQHDAQSFRGARLLPLGLKVRPQKPLLSMLIGALGLLIGAASFSVLAMTRRASVRGGAPR